VRLGCNFPNYRLEHQKAAQRRDPQAEPAGEHLQQEQRDERGRTQSVARVLRPDRGGDQATERHCDHQVERRQLGDRASTGEAQPTITVA
jgi:hypothetical protein